MPPWRVHPAASSTGLSMRVFMPPPSSASFCGENGPVPLARCSREGGRDVRAPQKGAGRGGAGRNVRGLSLRKTSFHASESCTQFSRWGWRERLACAGIWYSCCVLHVMKVCVFLCWALCFLAGFDARLSAWYFGKELLLASNVKYMYRAGCVSFCPRQSVCVPARF